MKYLSIFLLVVLFCLNLSANTSKNNLLRKATTHIAAKKIKPIAAGGKLYLRYSIFRGLRLTWLYLGNDGTFVVDPMNGVNPINYTAERQNNATNIGSYTNTANSISIHYDNGKTETWKVEYLNGALNTIDGLFIANVRSMPAGTKITGNFSSTVTMVGVARVQTLSFSNDGTFKVKNMGAINSTATSAMATKTDGGTYSMSGNTIHLNYNNGQASTAVIGVFGAGSTTYMVINDGFFEQPK